MTEQFLLEGKQFRLTLDFDVLESDIIYPNNTALKISVFSEGFSATAEMDIDAKRIPAFYMGMKSRYDTREGESVSAAGFGKKNITFTCDRYGHIFISGLLCSGGANGFWQELKFENAWDQTFLPRFLKEMERVSKKLLGG